MAPDPYDQERFERLQDPSAFRYCSGEELPGFLAPAPDWRVADFGSGTGRFTDELAPVAETVYAVDLRPGLHAVYREQGQPSNVRPVCADFGSLPFPANHLDGGVAVRTYHHGFEGALPAVSRVLRPGGRLVVVDWSATGACERPSRSPDHYTDLASVQSALLENGFSIIHAGERRETFVVVAANG